MDYTTDIVQVFEAKQDLPCNAYDNTGCDTSVTLWPQLPYVVDAVAQSLGDDAPMEAMGPGELEGVAVGEIVAEASVGGVGACDLLEHVLFVGTLVGSGREGFCRLTRQDFQRDESVFPVAEHSTLAL